MAITKQDTVYHGDITIDDKVVAIVKAYESSVTSPATVIIRIVMKDMGTYKTHGDEFDAALSSWIEEVCSNIELEDPNPEETTD